MLTGKTRNESRSILVVEDSDDDFEAVKRAFAAIGVHTFIERARSGEEALAYLRDEYRVKPGIILLDLNMPGMDGRKTLMAIKQDKALKSIPIVILSTSDDMHDVEASYDLGANTYIHKPAHFDGLVMAVKQVREYWFDSALLPKESKHG
jgi:two-component system response regulator